MSTEQPENDPFRKPQQPGGPPPHSQGPSGQEPSGPPPPPGHGSPYGNPPPPPGGGGYGGSGYGTEGQGGGGSPYDNPYGGAAGATDPLAGMPPLASRGKRLLARIIDALLIGIPIGIITALVEGGYSYDNGYDGYTYWPQLAYTVVYLVYEGLMLTSSGQTVGKKLMHIRVAMLQNGAVPAGSAGWLRAAVYQIPPLVPCIGSLFWLVNVLFCTWDKPYQQCLHDKTVRTVVVAAD
ncbi:RDD family protein [Streptomyces albus subsp. chlorinus]|uniref:RDD family protein n=1 Tax=Streptomyces albus TaxID=1888 RepID=UPI0015703D26|nr:RDD family protein [Streptomyces albus]NSC21928.1 RDD family protein [Streptomyces albus subsp. chlorinus]